MDASTCSWTGIWLPVLAGEPQGMMHVRPTCQFRYKDQSWDGQNPAQCTPLYALNNNNGMATHVQLQTTAVNESSPDE